MEHIVNYHMDLFVLTLHVVKMLKDVGDTFLKCFHFIKYARNVITLRATGKIPMVAKDSSGA